MIPSGYSSRHSSRQITQNRFSTETGVSSSASNFRSPQTHLGGASGYSSRNTYFRDTTDYDSELGHLLSPPSSPPSLEQVLAGEPSNSSSPRPIPTPSPNSSYQNLYDGMQQEWFAEPSSSPQLDAGAVATPSSNDGHRSLFYDFAQTSYVESPGSNRGSRQSAANQSTSRASQEEYSRYPGVYYSTADKRWRARCRDPTLGRRVSIGSYRTQSEAINALESYKVSLPPMTNRRPGGVYYVPHTRKWEAKYIVQGERVRLGLFSTKEEAETALKEHREARGLPPMRAHRVD